MTIIVRKEIYEHWLSETFCKEIPRIMYPIVKAYYKLKGYEVEVFK